MKSQYSSRLVSDMLQYRENQTDGVSSPASIPVSQVNNTQEQIKAAQKQGIIDVLPNKIRALQRELKEYGIDIDVFFSPIPAGYKGMAIWPSGSKPGQIGVLIEEGRIDYYSELNDVKQLFVENKKNAAPKSVKSLFRLVTDVPDEYDAKAFEFKKYASHTWVTFPKHSFLYCQHHTLQESEVNAYAGNKLHLSIKREELSKGFDVIKGLLFSPDSPIKAWKLTNLNLPKFQANPSNRITDGMQFTLYLYPDEDKEKFSDTHATTIKNFIAALEKSLSDAGIKPGIRPESDVAADHWQYMSYRRENEALKLEEVRVSDERSLSEEEKQRVHPVLKAQPIFKKLSQPE